MKESVKEVAHWFGVYHTLMYLGQLPVIIPWLRAASHAWQVAPHEPR